MRWARVTLRRRGDPWHFDELKLRCSVEIEPYYQSGDGMVTVYNARFEDVLSAGLVPAGSVALIHDDPPYGVNEQTRRSSTGRGMRRGLSGGRARVVYVDGKQRGTLHARDFPEVVGDEQPVDASPLLALDQPTVIWGGHLCQPALPRSASMLVWDKREDTPPDDNGDAELAWSNLGGPIRRFSHLWRGTCHASETGSRHRHPTQKPVAICFWIYERARLAAGQLVFVPHGGSGPDLLACRAMGLRLIWCDVERWCCDVAVARLPDAPQAIVERAQAFPRTTRGPRHDEPIGPLFGGVT